MKRDRALLGLAVGLVLSCSPVTAAEAQVRSLSTRPGPSAPRAVVVDSNSLVHIAQLLPVGKDGKVVSSSIDEQLSDVLRQMAATLQRSGSSSDLLAKVNVYAADSKAASRVRSLLTQRFAADDIAPAVSYVITPLPTTDARVALDAVAVRREAVDSEQLLRFDELPGDARASHASVAPQNADLVFVSGQAEPGDLAEATAGTLKSLERTLEHLDSSRDRILQVKAFLQPMEQVEVVERELQRFFEGQPLPPVTYVEWTSGGRNPIEIELVAAAPEADAQPATVDYITPPGMTSSPVFSRVARVHGGRLAFISGLYGGPDDAEKQVRSIFADLQALLEKADTDLLHLVKATYYVSDDESSKMLNELRPEFYDPQRPPAASKAPVKAVGLEGRTVTLDMIAVIPE